MQKAFTLIELLIVVAIIAILAAIAVPNFLEAQTRSKVSRGKADMRTLALGLDAYCVDYNKYPPDRGIHTINYCSSLTSPVAYLTTTSFDDPFNPAWNDIRPEWQLSQKDGSYLYVNYDDYYGRVENWGGRWLANRDRGWIRPGCVVSSFGPDRKHDALEWYPFFHNNPQQAAIHGKPHPENMVYDPSNGTISAGDFGRAIGPLECPIVIGG